MSETRIVQLKDGSETLLAPKTSSEAVIMTNGETLQKWLQTPNINEIWHTDGTNNNRVIKFRDSNTPYGHGIVVCGGANTIIGGGEAGYTLEAQYSVTDEVMVIGSDNGIIFHSNLNGDYDNRKTLTFDSSGTLQSYSVAGSWVDCIRAPSLAHNTPSSSSSASCGLTLRSTGHRYGICTYQDDFYINSITNSNYDSATNTLDKRWKFLANGGLTMSGACTASSHPTSSSIRYKENIIDLQEEEGQKVLQLRPVNYDYIDKEYGINCEGLIAEEVEEIMPNLVIYNEEGQPEALDYSRFVPSIIKLCQTQQQEIDLLKQEIAELKKEK